MTKSEKTVADESSEEKIKRIINVNKIIRQNNENI